MNDILVSIIIVNYNTCALTCACIDSIFQNVHSCKFEVILVDNASSDGSSMFIRDNYPQVRLIVLKENTGFSGAVNRGIREAKTPYVILLNNDTEVEKNFVWEMVRVMDQDERIFPQVVK